MTKVVKQLYEFGPFVLDPGERLLRHGAARMELPPRAFDTLLVLVENSGRLLEKDALMRTVWGDTVVEESNLTQVIYLLRKALRDGEDGSRYIETVPKRGYRFVASVREVEAAETNGNSRDVFASFSVPSSVLADRDSVVSSTAASSPSFESGAAEAAVPTPHATLRSGWDRGLTRGLTIVAVLALLAAVGWRRGLFGEAGPGPIRSVAV